jgi:5-methylcytosine-specific restriction endonuclease McrBC regulatory subunit McrC
MLQKVFSINLLDLRFETENENIWDFFLIYLFPYYLNSALKQGLYKEYVNKQFNDASVKGAIDINRYIKENLLFRGSIAYNTREYAFDNRMTQLIRHTIEFIKVRRFASVLNNNKATKDAVNLILQNTPSYNKSDRTKVVHDNKKEIHHPYFTEYKILQNICLRILLRDGLSYGQKEQNKVYGIVFDGAWLWEEYV